MVDVHFFDSMMNENLNSRSTNKANDDWMKSMNVHQVSRENDECMD